MNIAQSKSILVIDDDASILRTTQNDLADLSSDWHVLIATNGMDGIEILRNNPVDVILMSINFTGIKGPEIAARIRAMKNGKKVPILFMTTNRDNNVVQDPLLKPYGHLRKPFDILELDNLLRQILYVK